MTTRRDVRYQAAVIDDGRLLLLYCVPRDETGFWILPGGGRETGESETACVAREVLEEAGIEVAVGPLLYDVPADPPDGTYLRWRTYLCRIVRGEATPGGGEGWAELTAVRWLPLEDAAAWEPALCADPFLHPQLVRIRAALHPPMARTLRLVDQDPAWPARFAAEATRMRAALGDLARSIEHVGSTAVPGLAGKPVLDVAIAVASEADADACVAPLVSLGYTHRGAYGDDPRRRYYVRDVAGQRVAQIHLYVLPADAWNAKLAFRDALRASPALAAAYAAEKRRVAELVDWDKAAYSIVKGDFVERVLAELRAAAPPHE